MVKVVGDGIKWVFKARVVLRAQDTWARVIPKLSFPFAIFTGNSREGHLVLYEYTADSIIITTDPKNNSNRRQR